MNLPFKTNLPQGLLHDVSEAFLWDVRTSNLGQHNKEVTDTGEVTEVLVTRERLGLECRARSTLDYKHVGSLG